MKTLLVVLLTAILTLLWVWFARQEGRISQVTSATDLCSTTSSVTTYNEGTCVVASTWSACRTPWGSIVDHWDAIQSYNLEASTDDEACEMKLSICNDWVLSNSPYQYASCDWASWSSWEACDLGAENCSVNGFIFANGTSETFYTAWAVDADWTFSCGSQTRTCTDGETSGDDDYLYLNCYGEEYAACMPTPEPEVVEVVAPVVSAPVVQQAVEPTVQRQPNCPSPFGWAAWRPWQTWTWYAAASVGFGSSCEAIPLVCAFGSIRVWTEANPWEIAWAVTSSCTVGEPASCSSACWEVAHNASVTTYSEETIANGAGYTCADRMVTSTCTNGTLSAGAWSFCSCEVAPPAGCTTASGQTVAHESSLTLYEYPKVVAVPWDGSDTCVRQWRQCINGQFYTYGGAPSAFTFQYATCEVIEPPAWWGPGWEGVPTT
jgi:hypothetical protein